MKKFLKFILKWGLIAFSWMAVAVIIVIFYYLSDLPNLDSHDVQKSKQVVQVNYKDLRPLASFGDNVGSEVEFYELPVHLVNAVVATEDRRFFDHNGVDVVGILRAFYVNQKAGRIVQGGSTITQQLAKMLFLSPTRSFKRKIQEVLLAIQLEYSFSKEKILTLYLNRAYFGSGNYGVGDAAKFYFGKDVAQINLNESAMLAGLLKAPSKLSPKNNKKAAQERANVVLKNMIVSGFLNENHIAEIDQDVAYERYNLQKFYFADFVKDQYKDYLSGHDLGEKSISIKTTLDKKTQDGLEDALEDFIAKNAVKLKESQIAAVVMKKDGAVVAMSGGKDYKKSQFNRAVYAKRQSGSAFKTFVYLTAFENGYKPEDEFEDTEIDVASWVPKNYNDKYYGDVTLKEAFAKSLNSVAVQLAYELKREDIISTAKRLGIISQIDPDDLTIVLGTTQISLFELTAAYATIANNGMAVIPYSILEIKNNNEDSLYKRSGSGLGRVISLQADSYIKEIMREVVQNGTGKNANIAGDIYGKTGTSQDFRDAFFVGFNDEYVIGVWIGNDDNSPTNKITGGSLPAKLFAKIMREIY